MIEDGGVLGPAAAGALEHRQLGLGRYARHLGDEHLAIADHHHVREGSADVDADERAHSGAPRGVKAPNSGPGVRSTEHRQAWHLTTFHQPRSLITR